MIGPLDQAPITARLSRWMAVIAHGRECLFGFADWHPNTGGLSWLLSTHIVELDEAMGRARTVSGRIYALGREISARDLDEEGRTVLRLLLTEDSYPRKEDDLMWVITQKMARHLGLDRPPRADPAAVGLFFVRHRDAYEAHLAMMLASGSAGSS